MNLTSGKIQNLITLSAFLYQGSYFNPTEMMKVGGVNKKRIKKIVSTPSLTSIKLLFCMDCSSYTKFSTQHDENIRALPIYTGGKLNGVCYVLLCLSQFLNNWFCFVLLASTMSKYCSFPLNNWIVRTKGCVFGAWFPVSLRSYQGSRNRPCHSCKPLFVSITAEMRRW